MFLEKKLKADLGVRCYLRIFCSFLKALDFILKIIEFIMCFLGVIEDFLVLRVWFVVASNTSLRIIYLIFYIICWYPEEINVFFLWSDPGIPVDKDKGLNHVYWQPCTKRRAINTCKLEVPLIFSLRGRYWKIMVERRDKIGKWSWWSLYQVRTYSSLMAACADAELQKTLDSDSTLSLRILPFLEDVIGYPTVS